MWVRLTIAALAGCCVISCNKDDPGPQDLVTFTLEVNHEAWMFASDANGKVLDSKKLVFSVPVTLSVANPPETFTLTLVRKLTQTFAQLDISTYTGISPGRVFTPQVYKADAADRPNSIGRSMVEVTNYPSTQKLPLIVSDPWQGNTYNSSDQSTVSFSMNVWQAQQPQFLITGYKDDLLHPVYAFADAGNADTNLPADFSTFAPFEKTFDLKGFDTSLGARVSFQLYSFSSDQQVTGYRMANLDWAYAGTSPTVKIGYLDNFAEYYMSVKAYEYDLQSRKLMKVLSYFRLGSINTSMKFLDDDLTVNNVTMAAFAFDFTGEYGMRAHNFSYLTKDADISWVIYSDPGSSSLITEIPPDLVERYPDLSLTNMLYGSSSFYTFDDGFDYKQLVEERFKTSFGPGHPCYIQTFSN